jgi:hypothetical protein
VAVARIAAMAELISRLHFFMVTPFGLMPLKQLY